MRGVSTDEVSQLTLAPVVWADFARRALILQACKGLPTQVETCIAIGHGQ